MSTNQWAIETSALSKSYGSIEALRGLDMQVPTGSVHGFLGRNGAGKTTTMKTLLGMVRPTSGTARVLGLDALSVTESIEIRKRTAFVPEDKDLYDSMSVEQMIRFTASFYPGWRKDLEDRYRRKFELRTDQIVKALSRGTRTKLALLLALCRGVELLILDEPTSGLDPAIAEEVLQSLVAYVSSEGTTVFFSSHQIAEVEQIADRVTILSHGRAVVAGELDELRQNYKRIQLVFSSEAPREPFRVPGLVSTHRNGRSLTLLSSNGAERAVEEARSWNPVSVDVTAVTLKDIFLETVREDV